MTEIGRREFLANAAVVTLATLNASALMAEQGTGAMFGMIGKMKTVEGQRDALIKILLGGTGQMPGCLSYVVAQDPADPNAIWITEVWDNKASHDASLTLPAVKEAISKGRPMIAGFEMSVETRPVGRI